MVVFRADPCGIICILFTYVAVGYADYVVVQYLVMPAMSDNLWGAVNVFLFNILLFLLLVSHVRAVISDPGIVPLPAVRVDFSDMHSHPATAAVGSPPAAAAASNSMRIQAAAASILGYGSGSYQHAGLGEGEGAWSVCTKCETYRPPRAHHCRTCRRCIRRMDHHCPWINNCVGEYNQKYFIQFLFYTGVTSVYALVLTAVAWFAFDCAECHSSYGNYRQTRVIHSIILTVESVLFGVFVIAILCDQLNAIFTDETPIEQLQRERPGSHLLQGRQYKSKTTLLIEVFGRGKNKWFWLCPCQSGPAAYRQQQQHSSASPQHSSASPQHTTALTNTPTTSQDIV